MIDYTTIKKVHFVGIGGIGMSAIVRMMLAEGKVVTGSDRGETTVTKELQKLGVDITFGHHAENIPQDVDVVIYTIAIPADNPEFQQAKKQRVPLVSYPEMLGILSKEKFTVAVAGTHGKTTTTAMISKILGDAELSPTVIVGSLLQENKSNFIAGKSNILVVEACEYKRSFLNLTPDILVITNIDSDHLDYYTGIEDIQSAFSECVGRVKEGGVVVTNLRHQLIQPIIGGDELEYIDYSTFDNTKIELSLPGQHNKENAQAALAVAQLFDVPDDVSLQALQDFKGTWRRFEYKGKTASGVDIYDDYAHHPTEIQATLTAAREFFGERKITVLFQPHLYSRTELLLDELAESFGEVDEVVVAPIYAAREEPRAGVTSEILCEKIKSYNKNVICLPLDEIEAQVEKQAERGGVIITMGAGDIYTVGEDLLKQV